MTAPSSSSTFVFEPAADRKVEALAQSTNITKDELLRRALALYSLLQEKAGSTGNKVIVENPTTGSRVEITL